MQCDEISKAYLYNQPLSMRRLHACTILYYLGIEYNLCIDEMSLNNLRTGTMTRFRRLCARQHVKVGHTKCQNV